MVAQPYHPFFGLSNSAMLPPGMGQLPIPVPRPSPFALENPPAIRPPGVPNAPQAAGKPMPIMPGRTGTGVTPMGQLANGDRGLAASAAFLQTDGTTAEALGNALAAAGGVRQRDDAVIQQQGTDNATATYVENLGRSDLAMMARAGLGKEAFQSYSEEKQAEIEAKRDVPNSYKEFELAQDNPGYDKFVREGKRPTLTATDRKAILEADEMASDGQNVISTLDHLLEINDEIYSGITAPGRATFMSALGDDAATKTVAAQNEITGMALEQLKAIFGGMPTEGERAILIEIQGSVNLRPEARKRIWEKAKRLAQIRVNFYKQRAEELRNGDFYGPDGGSSGPAAPSVWTTEDGSTIEELPGG
jgi:hypothetical protein